MTTKAKLYKKAEMSLSQVLHKMRNFDIQHDHNAIEMIQFRPDLDIEKMDKLVDMDQTVMELIAWGDDFWGDRSWEEIREELSYNVVQYYTGWDQPMREVEQLLDAIAHYCPNGSTGRQHLHIVLDYEQPDGPKVHVYSDYAFKLEEWTQSKTRLTIDCRDGSVTGWEGEDKSRSNALQCFNLIPSVFATMAQWQEWTTLIPNSKPLTRVTVYSWFVKDDEQLHKVEPDQFELLPHWK